MSHRPASRRRVLVPLILATVLAAEIAGVAFAGRRQRSAATGPGSAGPQLARASPRTLRSRTMAADGGDRRQLAHDPATSRRAGRRPLGPTAPAPASVAVRVHVRPERNRGAAARPSSQPRSGRFLPAPRPVTAGTTSGSRASASTGPWPRSRATRTRPPDNHVYRWGCAGRNNVYLLGHAYSVFEPLHDAYVAGRLRKGMTVDYADGAGVVRTYSVAWWRVVRPTSAAAWAWAPQSRPSMTLQTCVGANSELRLIVRLIATD